MAAAGQAQRYGLDVLGAQRTGGAEQRAIEQQGIAADLAQFTEERDDPKRNLMFMQSLLQGLPLETQTYSSYEPSGLQSLSGGLSSVGSLGAECAGIGLRHHVLGQPWCAHVRPDCKAC